MDLFSESDGFVEVYLDNKDQKQKTKVIRNSKNPRWNETIVLNHFEGQDILHVDVYDEDPIVNDLIGSFTIDLRDLYEKQRIENWFTIPSKSGRKSRGEVYLILKYQPLKL